MTGRRRAPAVVLALLFAVAGCGGMAKMQPAGEPPTSNVDELEQRIAHQESVIDNQLAARKAPTVEQRGQPAGGEVAPSVESAPPAAPEAAPPPKAAEAPEEAAPEENEAPVRTSAAVGASVGSTCDLVCRALASMRRSADRICEIVGEKDPRCTQARSRVEHAAQRVAGAGCTCSG